MPTSLFPDIKYEEILEIEFAISNKMGIPFDYNNKEFFELIWIYDRLVKQVEEEKQAARESAGETSLGNLSPGLLSQMQGE